ncbi:MAG: hypothetical protein PHU98_14055 [Mariniphaga sp.]|nr:hypothetical protein [Mariniphaga sp.]
MTKLNLLVLVLIIGITKASFAQDSSDAANKIRIAGSASLTNNGISLIPNFSLGDPAALFNLSITRGRLSFDTDFNFSLEAKPWYILYWLRYQVVNQGKFQVGLATHLGLNFKPSDVLIDANTGNTTITERYWVVDVSPRYSISENLAVGIYYLHSVGLDQGTVGNSNFITLNANFSNIQLLKDVYLAINPQIYYLKQDHPDGIYFTSTFTLSKSNCPVSISSLLNKEIETDITAGKGFVWNISVKYSISK